MAVEIPVYVNISEGINQAIRELPKEMPKLEKALTRNALKVEVEIDKTGLKKSVDELLTSSQFSLKELSTALANIRKQFDAEMQNSIGKEKAPASVNNLIRAYTALEQRITGARNSSTAAMMSIERAVARVQYKIATLTAQRNKAAKGSAEWNKANYAILQQEQRIKQLNTQYEVYRLKSKQAGASAAGSIKGVNGALTAQSTILSGLIGMLGSYVSVFGLVRFAKQIRDVTGQLEYQRIALGHLIQDEEYGSRLFEQIKKDAVESPFRIKDLVTYTKQLAAYRIETTKLRDTTKMLADISAGLGVDMNRLILAYGQVRAASVLRGQELRQFTEAGIPLVELLADKFSELNGRVVSTGEVFQLISKRMVPFQMIEQIFQDMTEAGGQFYQMQETQAQTLQGRWEKLKDVFDLALQSIGDSETFRKANDNVLAILNALAKHLNIIPKLIKGITTSVVGFLAISKVLELWQKRYLIQNELINAQLVLRRVRTQKLTVAEASKLVQSKLLARAEAKLAVANTLVTKTLNKMWIAMLKNPITAILALVGGLIAAIVSFRTKTKEATDAMEEMNEWTDTIEAQGRILGGSDRMDSLIKRYERLSKKTKRTAKEQQSLTQAMRVLQLQFPQVQLALNSTTDSLAKQVDALKKANKEQRENAIAVLESTKATLEEEQAELSLEQQRETISWLQVSRRKRELEAKKEDEKLTRKEKRELKRLTAEYDELGNSLNTVSTRLNTVQNRLVTIENLLNPKSDSNSPTVTESERLRQLREMISDVNNAYKKYIELRKYMNKEEALKDIGILYPSLGGLEPTYENMVSTYNKLLEKYKNDPAASRLIEQALANVRFDKIKSDMDKTIKRLSDEIKTSQAARDFFNNIFGATGNKEIATNLTVSVYGEAGSELEKKLRDELSSAFVLDDEKLKAAGLSIIQAHTDVAEAIQNGDYLLLQDYLNYVVEANHENAKKILDDRIKNNAEWYKNFVKTYAKARSYEERLNTIEDQRQAALKEAEGKVDASGMAAINQYYDRQAAGVRLEAIKDTYTWTKAFENLEGVSNETLNNLIDLIDEYIQKYGKDLEPNQLKELVRARERAEAQKLERNSLSATGGAFKRYANQLAIVNMMNKSAMKGTEEYTKHADELQDAIKDLSDGMGQLISEYEQLASSAKDLMNVFATDEDASYFGEQMDNVSKGLSGAAKATVGVARMAAGDFSPQAIISTVTGISDIITSIFGARNAARIRKYNKEIERQQELLDNLSYAYERLEAAEKDAFGAEYIENYQQRLAILNAEVEAYRKQAEAERKKGKKADEDKIKDLENQARDTKDAIEDMRSEISEKFLGSDLTSASRDFASAWLDAYKVFGSTTGAIKEKFSDMIQGMITESLAARIVEQNLEGIFKLVDDLSNDDGQLSVTDAAMIAAKAQEVTGTIDVGLTNLMNALSATGLNLRSMGAGLTGISKDLAGASEESILGLAAGVNTQNYYMAHIDQNVAAILSILGGSPEAAGGPATSTTLSYTSSEEFQLHMSNLDTNLAELLSSFKKVITPKNANDNTYCVAIK